MHQSTGRSQFSPPSLNSRTTRCRVLAFSAAVRAVAFRLFWLNGKTGEKDLSRPARNAFTSFIGSWRSVVDSLRPYTNTLWRRLDPGLARQDDLGLGLLTSEDGALIGRDGTVSRVFYSLGPPRKGTLLETTAIPEIRVQAAALARVLATAPDQVA
jgi:hypothetical protein